MNKIYRILLSLLLLFLLIAAIFFFSEQSGTDSNTVSKEVSYRIAASWENTFSTKFTAFDIEYLAGKLNGPVRKAAHLSIYALLGFGACLGCNLVFGSKKLRFTHIIVCVLLVVLVATCDEINQYYSGGRGASAKDILLDTVGGSFGIYFVFMIRDFFGHIKTGIERGREHRESRNKADE